MPTPTPGLEIADGTCLPPAMNPSRHIGNEVAHELNNIFAIIRGFTDRLLAKHGGDTELRPDLQLISENARRAERVVKQAVQTTRPAPPAAV